MYRASSDMGIYYSTCIELVVIWVYIILQVAILLVVIMQKVSKIVIGGFFFGFGSNGVIIAIKSFYQEYFKIRVSKVVNL